MLGFSNALTVARERLPFIGGLGGGKNPNRPEPKETEETEETEDGEEGKKGRKKFKRMPTDILPPVSNVSLSQRQPRSQTTERLKRVESLSRTPLLVEFVGSGSIAGVSSPIRPDLIGKTISGGEGPSGATSTANIGLRSSPSGYANYGNIRRSAKNKKKRKSKKR